MFKFCEGHCHTLLSKRHTRFWTMTNHRLILFTASLITVNPLKVVRLSQKKRLVKALLKRKETYLEMQIFCITIQMFFFIKPLLTFIFKRA